MRAIEQDDLKEMGVKSMGHRKIFMEKINALNAEHASGGAGDGLLDTTAAASSSGFGQSGS